jgi:hypothetical protein
MKSRKELTMSSSLRSGDRIEVLLMTERETKGIAIFVESSPPSVFVVQTWKNSEKNPEEIIRVREN